MNKMWISIKEIEVILKAHILQLKNTITEVQDALERFNSRLGR